MADLIVLDIAGEDEFGIDTVRQLLRHGHGQSDKFVTIQFGHDLEAGFSDYGSYLWDDSGNGQSASARFPLEGIDQYLANIRAVVVKGLAGSEFLDVVKVTGRGGRNDFVASRHRKLNGATADARCSSPYKKCLASRLGR